MLRMKILVFLIACLYLSGATSEDVREKGQVDAGTDGKVSLGENKVLEHNSRKKSLTTVAEGVSVSSDELLSNLKDKLPVERNAHPSVYPRKGVERPIIARKGAESTPTPIETEIPPTIKPTELIKNTNAPIEATPLNIDLLKNIKINDTTATTEKIKIDKKIRLKPTATVAGVGDDDTKLSVAIQPTKTPPLESSSKIKYVVPVIITILVLPLFVIFVIFLYRNGRECWEKRHYRRMDFLIDGMYNE